MQHITIFRSPEVYASHASVCQAKNGDLLVAFRHAPFEHIFAHVHPEAKVGMVRSTDMGKTWSEMPEIIMDPGSGININDPSLTTLSDGTIILTAFTFPCPTLKDKDKWGDEARPVRGNDYFYVPGQQNILISRSFDNGYTWEPPYELHTRYYSKGSCSVFASIVETGDGTLLMPVSERSAETGEQTAVLLCSEDKGKMWDFYSRIITWNGIDDPCCFGLPSVTVSNDGRMLAAGWNIEPSGTLITSSEDGGKTWSEACHVDTDGACMHLTTTSRNSILLSYGYRNPPYGIRVLPGSDSGRIWNTDLTCVLRSDGAMRDLGYPRTIQLSDGRLLCVYYFNEKDEDKSYYNEEESLKICSEWNLDPELYTYKTAGLRFIAGTFFTEEELNDPRFRTSHTSVHQQDGPTLI